MSITDSIDTAVQQVNDSLQTVSPDSLTSDTLELPFNMLTDTTLHAVKDMLHYASWPVTLFGDTLIPFRSYHSELFQHGEPLAYSPFRDDAVMGIIAFCFFLFLILMAWSRKHLKTQLQDFFVPSNNQPQMQAIPTHAEVYAPTLITFVESLLCGVVLFVYIGHCYDLQLGVTPPLLVLGVSIGAFLGYHLLRWLLYHFINWIFFDKMQRHAWNSGFSLLSTVETILFFPIIIYGLHQGWELQNTILYLVIAYGLVRFLLLYHSYRIFFPKIYGVLHLFAYLCTLELLPLLQLWVIFQLLSTVLIVK